METTGELAGCAESDSPGNVVTEGKKGHLELSALLVSLDVEPIEQ